MSLIPCCPPELANESRHEDWEIRRIVFSFAETSLYIEVEEMRG